MIRYTNKRAAFVLAALALQPFAAMAQSTAPAPKAVAATPPAMSDTALPKDAGMRLDQHNKQLHDELGITAAQQPQWDQFTAVMRTNAMDMRRAFTDRGTKFETMNAADNMQSYADMAKLHAENMAKASAAFQTLYAALSPEQKLTADNVFRNRAAKAATKAAAKKS